MSSSARESSTNMFEEGDDEDDDTEDMAVDNFILVSRPCVLVRRFLVSRPRFYVANGSPRLLPF